MSLPLVGFILTSTLCLAAGPAPDVAPSPTYRKGMDVSPVNGEGSTRVSMRAEVVEITLHPNMAEVRVVFDMVNTGSESETLEVGFPTDARPEPRPLAVAGGKGFSSPGTIYAFRAMVDGVQVEVERKEVDEEDPREIHRNWVCWPMTFEAGQACEIEVSYQVETRDDFYIRPHSPMQAREVIYILQTGRGWHGPIGSARILLRAAEGFDLGRVEEVEPRPTRKEEGLWEWVMKDFEPEEDIRVRYRVIRTPGEALERVLAGRRRAPDEVRWVLDEALCYSLLGKDLEAAEIFEALAIWDVEVHPWARFPENKILSTRLYEITPHFLAARHFAAAGERDRAREPWARMAALQLDERIASIQGYLERYGDDPTHASWLEREREKLARQRERRSEMGAILADG